MTPLHFCQWHQCKCRVYITLSAFVSLTTGQWHECKEKWCRKVLMGPFRSSQWHQCRLVDDTDADYWVYITLSAFVSLTIGQWHECTLLGVIYTQLVFPDFDLDSVNFCWVWFTLGAFVSLTACILCTDAKEIHLTVLIVKGYSYFPPKYVDNEFDMVAFSTLAFGKNSQEWWWREEEDEKDGNYDDDDDDDNDGYDQDEDDQNGVGVLSPPSHLEL